MLLIPESRKQPITESLLYKQIVQFFEEEKIQDKFEIKFITIPKSQNLPQGKFPGRRSWVSKETIEEMAGQIIDYLKETEGKYESVVAYVRGSYLEAVRLAGVESLLREEELAPLKKKGIRWMKVGLRMGEAFEIFKKRIIEFNGEPFSVNIPKVEK